MFLINPYRYVSGGIWTPAVLGPLAWYDPSDNTQNTWDGSGNLTQGNDLSGNGYHLTAPSGDGPTFSNINGNSAWNFNSQYLLNANLPWTGNHCIYTVANLDTTTGYKYLISGTDGSLFQIFFGTDSGTRNFMTAYGTGGAWNSAGAVANTPTTEVALDADGSNVLSITNNNTDSTPRVDGTPLTPKDGTLTNFTGIVLGARNSSKVEPWDGRVGETLIFSSPLSAANLINLDGYYSSKWGGK